jgi:hypothetical protein
MVSSAAVLAHRVSAALWRFLLRRGADLPQVAGSKCRGSDNPWNEGLHSCLGKVLAVALGREQLSVLI